MTEKINLVSITEIVKDDDNENNFLSIEFIWKWIIEVLYNTSSSRYEWFDFC